MSVTSANLDDLQTFLTGAGNRSDQIEASYSAARSKAATVTAACSFQHPSTPSVSALRDLLHAWRENRRFVQVIRDELVEADQYDADGNPVVASAVIDAALWAASAVSADSPSWWATAVSESAPAIAAGCASEIRSKVTISGSSFTP